MQVQQKLFTKLYLPLFSKSFHNCCLKVWLSLVTPSVALLLHLILSLFSFQGAWFGVKPMVENNGIEPLTSWMQIRRSPSWANPPYNFFGKWWARVGSNHRPYDYQSYALASWATGPSSRVRMYPQNWTMQEFEKVWPRNVTQNLWSCEVSLERRWSSRSFSNGYLVTTSPQLPNPPSAASSI